MIRDTVDGSGHFLYSKEGVTKGDPLTMIAYGIWVLHLIREPQGAHLRVTQPWYPDDAGAGGNFVHMLAHIWDLQAWGLSRGYFPEPTKTILVVSPRNVARAEEFFRGRGIKVVTGHRYIGGFIGYSQAENRWLSGKITE